MESWCDSSPIPAETQMALRSATDSTPGRRLAAHRAAEQRDAEAAHRSASVSRARATFSSFDAH
jgi:hypothetical protein